MIINLLAMIIFLGGTIGWFIALVEVMRYKDANRYMSIIAFAIVAISCFSLFMEEIQKLLTYF